MITQHSSRISAQIIEHTTYNTYVGGANTALEKLEEAREKGDLPQSTSTKNLAFNLGEHSNHSVFWKNMTPEGQGRPEGELAAAIDEYFGSFEKFQAQFTAVATGIQGSGWAILAYDTISDRLVTFQLFDQQGNVPVGVVPLLMLDMWEHAFYLDYKNVKGDYVKAWWNVVNWEDVAKRFDTAREKFGDLLVAKN